MSAKRRKPLDPKLDFDSAEATLEMPNSAADVVRLAKNGSLAAQRALLLAQQLRSIRVVQTTESKGGRGRRRDPRIEKAVAQYEFDVDHFDALRAIGWGNVPPDKHVLRATVRRNWPHLPQDKRLLDSKCQALKDAVKQRRLKQRC